MSIRTARLMWDLVLWFRYSRCRFLQERCSVFAIGAATVRALYTSKRAPNFGGQS